MQTFRQSLLLGMILIVGIFGMVGAEEVTIIFQSPTNELRDPAMTAMAKEYSDKHPGIKVEFRSFSGSLMDMETKLLLVLSRGVGEPDIFITEYSSAYTWASSGWLQELPGDLVKTMEGEIAYEALAKPVTIKNKMIGIPWTLASFVLAYNKAYFAEAGLTGPPKTWDELISYAQKLTKYDANGRITRSGWSIRKSGHPQGIAAKWSQFYYAAGGEKLFDQDGVYFNNKAARDALQLYLDAIYKYKVDAFDLEGDYTGFGKGLNAMVFREPQTLSLLYHRYPNFDFGVAGVPAKARPATLLTGLIAVVNKHSKHQKEVWDYLRWFYQPEQVSRWTCQMSAPPMFKKAAKNKCFDKELFQVEIRQSQDSKNVFVDPPVNGSFEMLSVLGKYIEKVCYRNMGIDDALSAAEKEIATLLKRKRQ
jgi:multiple sugar transport system substrate-binding protein